MPNIFVFMLLLSTASASLMQDEVVAGDEAQTQQQAEAIANGFGQRGADVATDPRRRLSPLRTLIPSARSSKEEEEEEEEEDEYASPSSSW